MGKEGRQEGGDKRVKGARRGDGMRTWIETQESGVKVLTILLFLHLWSLVGHLMRIDHAVK